MPEPDNQNPGAESNARLPELSNLPDEVIRKVAERVYQMILADLKVDFERGRVFLSDDFHRGRI